MRVLFSATKLVTIAAVSIGVHVVAVSLRATADLLDPGCALRAPDRFDVLDTDDIDPDWLPSRRPDGVRGHDGAAHPGTVLSLTEMRQWGWITEWVGGPR